MKRDKQTLPNALNQRMLDRQLILNEIETLTRIKAPEPAITRRLLQLKTVNAQIHSSY